MGIYRIKTTTPGQAISKTELAKTILDTQVGLVEAYEFTDGAYKEVTDLQLAIVEIYEALAELGG